MINLSGKSIYLTEVPFSGEPTMLSVFRSNWDDNQWLIDFPVNMSTGNTVRPTTSVPVRIHFFDDYQVEHYFDSKMERLFYNPLYLKLEKVELDTIIRKERRRYPRIKTQLDLLLLQTNHHSPSIKTQTVDISGGGLCFQLTNSSHAHLGNVLIGCLFLPYHSIGFRCRIVRVLQNGDGTSYVGTEFIEIKDSDRAEIISYCMHKHTHQTILDKIMGG